MLNKKDVERTIIREEGGLRFIGFDELEGMEVTIKEFPEHHLVIQPGRAGETVAPHITAIVRDGFAAGEALLEFTREAFNEKRQQAFLAVATPLIQGERRVDYYQYPNAAESL